MRQRPTTPIMRAMHANTIRTLNQINANFYAAVAADFDETRGTPWPGWKSLLPYCAGVKNVLDAGCGNGRFGLFLAESLDRPLRYHGVDFSEALLDVARSALETDSRLAVRLTARDMIEHGMAPACTSDLVGAFGLMHHIPGREYRRLFIRQLAGLVAPGGVLAVAFWRSSTASACASACSRGRTNSPRRSNRTTIYSTGGAARRPCATATITPMSRSIIW
ncbi:MAG: class I SAM-dependent methyltransferase [Chloroflexi bacterium]|nr:class I SAM-dependent methyltransferase [Chloroflexota bacterium]